MRTLGLCSKFYPDAAPNRKPPQKTIAVLFTGSWAATPSGVQAGTACLTTVPLPHLQGDRSLLYPVVDHLLRHDGLESECAAAGDCKPARGVRCRAFVT